MRPRDGSGCLAAACAGRGRGAVPRAHAPGCVARVCAARGGRGGGILVTVNHGYNGIMVITVQSHFPTLFLLLHRYNVNR